MSDIRRFHAWLWGERRIVSVANLTRQDGDDFMRVAGSTALQVTTHSYPLDHANQALDDLRAGRFAGAAVLLARGSTG
jgi:propanol-preferring alcohol dehydrogenase